MACKTQGQYIRRLDYGAIPAERLGMDMRKLGSLWCTFTLIAFTLSVAAVGCGDDDDTSNENAGSAGGAGQGGAGGKGGSGAKGGSGGKSGAGGQGGQGGQGGSAGASSAAQCVTQSTAIFKNNPKGLSAECIACACKEGAAAIVACNNDAEKCWGLSACVQEKCPDRATQATCAQAMCGSFLSAGLEAQAVGMVLNGSACSAKCASDSADAGPADAGN
jgi:hypothetical protein